MKNLSPIDENKDVVTKEYVDGIISETKREINVSHAVDIATVYDDISKVKNDVAVNRTTLGNQCKNLLKNTAKTQKVNNVTFTVNSNGSITATQTTTAPGNATITVATITLKPGTYVLTGDYEIKKSGFGEIRFYIGSTVYSANTAHTFDTEVTITVKIFVWKGVNINGSKTIYPMLRYADIIDDTYEPYNPSLQEQINEIDEQINVLNKNFYINYVNGKSTSNYYDYGTACSSVMIYVASEGTGVDTGGIYFINANGSLISFIQKTGIEIEIDSSNHRFRVTNNTSKMICVIAQTLMGGV